MKSPVSVKASPRDRRSRSTGRAAGPECAPDREPHDRAATLPPLPPPAAAVCVLNADGILVAANPAMRERFEPVHGELRGLKYRALLSTGGGAESASPWDSVLLGGAPVVVETEFAGVPGACRVELHPVLGEGPRPAGAVAVVHDVTEPRSGDSELHRQKELLQKIVDNIPVMLNFVEPAGRIRWINAYWERVLGWSLQEAQRLDIFAEAYPDPSYCLDVLAYVRAAPPGWRDFRTRRKDGHIIDTTWAIVPLSDGTTIGIGQDITERKHVEQELRTSREQLRRLSARTEYDIEQERTALARELHDELGQLLTTLKMDLAWVRERIPSCSPAAEAVRDKTAVMLAAIDTTIGQVRRISAGLRPIALDRLGLLEAIDWQAGEFERTTGVRCRFESELDSLALDIDRATQVFRIVQEALTNATRHATATRVTITARQRGGRLVLEIRDNGRGISDEALADPNALGLLGMRERARVAGGELKVARGRRKGTIVAVAIPLDRPSIAM